MKFMDNLNFFSIIIITYNREDLVEKLLCQIANQAPQAEIILIHNSDRPLERQSLQENVSFYLCQSFSTPAMARNEALKHATKSWVVFFDDDIVLPDHYFLNAFELLNQHPDTDLFGGPDQTPSGSSFFATALGLTLQSPMATAHTRLRHLRSHKKVMEATERDLILCHLWIRNDFIKKHDVRFPDNYFRNEENLLIHQVKLLKAKILYFSDLYVYHYRKSQLRHLFFAVFRSGLYRIKSFREMFTISGLLFFIPTLWCLFLVSSLYQITTVGHLHIYFQSLWAIYLTASVVATTWVTKTRPQYFFVALFYQFFINLIYGMGTLIGLLRLFRFS